MLSLITRRTLAFCIDVILILICMALLIFLTSNLFGMSWDEHTINLLFWVLIIVYFGLTEWGDGQSPGKASFRIYITSQDQNIKPGMYESFYRVVLIMLIPVFIEFITSYATKLFNMSTVVSLPFVIFSIGSMIIWPVSIIFGRGRIGLHDLLSNTMVKSFHNNNDVYQVSDKRKYIVTVIGGYLLICSIVVFSILDFTKNVFKGMDDQTGTKYQQILRYLVFEDNDYVYRNINKPELYIKSLGSSYNLNKPSITFNDLPNLEKSKILNNYKYNNLYEYNVDTTLKGLTSAEFQREIAYLILENLGGFYKKYDKDTRKTTVVVFTFYYKKEILNFKFSLDKRVIGIISNQYNKNGEWELMYVVEPDNANNLTFNWLFLPDFG